MNKKILAFMLTMILFSSCSLFQKDNTEQTSTIQNNSEQQENLEINSEGQKIEETTQTGTLEEEKNEKNSTETGSENKDLQTSNGTGNLSELSKNEEITQTGVIEELKEEPKVTEEQKEKNLSVKEQIINKLKSEQEKTIASNIFPTDYTISTETALEEGGFGDGITNTTTIDLGNYIAQIQDSSGCVGRYNSQVVTNKSGEKIDKLPYSDIPEKIKIGNVEYNYNSNNIQFSDKVVRSIPFDSQTTILTDIPIKNSTNISIDTLKNSFSGGILSVGSYLPEIVYIKFNEFPIYFSYEKSTNIPLSFLIVKLTSEEEKLVGADGKVLDIDLTDKLIKKYTTGISGKIEGFANSENRKYVTEIEETAKENTVPLEEDGGKVYEKLVLEESDLPIINLYKLDNNGYYSISFYEPYKYVTYAELCKPAIYVYTPTPQNQSVEIQPANASSYFTKIIPNFDAKNTWNYTTNPNKGNIIGTDKNTYDYLYYSIKVPNYEFNTNGWQVKGSDIKTFFEDKLQKIGFNEKEKNDFIEYWLELYSDENAYYFVSFKYNEEVDKYVKLNFNETPSSQFRVLLESYKLSEKFENDYFKYENVGDKFDKYLIKKAERNSNFDVFEWGGVFYKEEENKFIVH